MGTIKLIYDIISKFIELCGASLGPWIKALIDMILKNPLQYGIGGVLAIVAWWFFKKQIRKAQAEAARKAEEQAAIDNAHKIDTDTNQIGNEIHNGEQKIDDFLKG